MKPIKRGPFLLPFPDTPLTAQASIQTSTNLGTLTYVGKKAFDMAHTWGTLQSTAALLHSEGPFPIWLCVQKTDQETGWPRPLPCWRNSLRSPPEYRHAQTTTITAEGLGDWTAGRVLAHPQPACVFGD
ncbi:hypothetical protein CEXT_390941 [Caerostris extrusa]|uniref:Uncharacterized protein n=1 Tax=Caerostris extrusa TaxID=172846 RepID=A0AAV4RMN8_CAEEX|nr:hypothetical protein CEXT_390941 [Caerostris extrusa]